MSVRERVEQLRKMSQETNVHPSSRLQEVLAKSRVEQAVQELSEINPLEIKKEVIEEGRKMVIVVKWPMSVGQGYQQIILSIREDSIAFMGRNNPQQYLRLEKEEVFRADLVEDYLARTFINPEISEARPMSPMH